MTGSRFLGSDLTMVTFDPLDDQFDPGEYSTPMSYIDFTSAVLYGADLSFAGLAYASLRDADLMDATIYDVWLSEADIKGANIDDALGQSVLRSSPELEESRLLNALCGYETFASSHPDAAQRGSCQEPRPS